MDNWENSAERWEAIEDIITLRASFLIDRAITGLAIDFDKALTLLRDFNNFTTEKERQQRDILVAAIDNLVDFAAAEEWAMLNELPEDLEEDMSEEYEDVFDKYNSLWAEVENDDVYFAATIAAWWIGVSSETIITYTTQRDNRVRPWHSALDGVSYPKHAFPSELIPPIEYGCRCFLTANGYGSVSASINGSNFSDKVHPVFKESLATCGKIFSDEHPYFRNTLPLQVKQITHKIKQKFYGEDIS